MASCAAGLPSIVSASVLPSASTVCCWCQSLTWSMAGIVRTSSAFSVHDHNIAMFNVPSRRSIVSKDPAARNKIKWVYVTWAGLWSANAFEVNASCPQQTMLSSAAELRSLHGPMQLANAGAAGGFLTFTCNLPRQPCRMGRGHLSITVRLSL